MAKNIFFLLILFTVASVSYSQAQTKGIKTDTARVDFKFTDEEWDFGTIPPGKPVKHVFTFTNTGNQPLIITNVKPSCSCTVPNWPKKPILPGQTGEIEVQYNTASHEGAFKKYVTVISNAAYGPMELYIRGIVEIPTVPPNK